MLYWATDHTGKPFAFNPSRISGFLHHNGGVDHSIFVRFDMYVDGALLATVKRDEFVRIQKVTGDFGHLPTLTPGDYLDDDSLARYLQRDEAPEGGSLSELR